MHVGVSIITSITLKRNIVSMHLSKRVIRDETFSASSEM
jgi:hypothetical protein